MGRKDKLLDILAMAQLPEQVKLARLARPWLGKAFSREQAKAIVKVYFDTSGRTNELTKALMDEKLRQERIQNFRRATKAVLQGYQRSLMDRFKASKVGSHRADIEKRDRVMEIALRTFCPHVRENFNEDTLALMSLIEGEDRRYEVRWLDAGFRPVRCALIEVVTVGQVKGSQYNRFLLYKAGGRVLAARTAGRDLMQAWASQLPEVFVAAAPTLATQGYTFKSDLEAQEMIVFSPDGTEYKRIEWLGRTVDE